jgi:hypothetical protein
LQSATPIADDSSASSIIDSASASSSTSENLNPVAPTTTGSCSITVYGHIEVVTEKEKANELREFHLLKNPKYPQFIVGEDIAILRIMPTRARICDIRDKVEDWRSGSSS